MKNPHPYPKMQSVLSLEPLLDFWRSDMVPRCSHMAEMFASFETRIHENPDLQGDISDPAVLEEHRDVITALMSVAIPAAAWENREPFWPCRVLRAYSLPYSSLPERQRME